MANKTKQAIQQGNLDGLCGLYSAINVVNLLYPKSNAKLRKQLFKLGVTHLDNKGERKLKNYILNGMRINIIKQIIKKPFKEYIEKKTKYSLKYSMIAKNEVDIRGVNNSITDYLSDDENPYRAVIVGIASDKYDHWTVIANSSLKKFNLQDSDGMKLLSKDKLSTSEILYGNKKIRVLQEEVLGIELFEK